MTDTEKTNEAPNGPSASKARLDHCAIPYTNATLDIIRNAFYSWRLLPPEEIHLLKVRVIENGTQAALDALLAGLEADLLRRIDIAFDITRFAEPAYLNSPDEV